jgi:hypothetical protein
MHTLRSHVRKGIGMTFLLGAGYLATEGALYLLGSAIGPGWARKDWVHDMIQGAALMAMFGFIAWAIIYAIIWIVGFVLIFKRDLERS